MVIDALAQAVASRVVLARPYQQKLAEPHALTLAATFSTVALSAGVELAMLSIRSQLLAKGFRGQSRVEPLGSHDVNATHPLVQHERSQTWPSPRHRRARSDGVGDSPTRRNRPPRRQVSFGDQYMVRFYHCSVDERRYKLDDDDWVPSPRWDRLPQFLTESPAPHCTTKAPLGKSVSPSDGVLPDLPLLGDNEPSKVHGTVLQTFALLADEYDT